MGRHLLGDPVRIRPPPGAVLRTADGTQTPPVPHTGRVAGAAQSFWAGSTGRRRPQAVHGLRVLPADGAGPRRRRTRRPHRSLAVHATHVSTPARTTAVRADYRARLHAARRDAGSPAARGAARWFRRTPDIRSGGLRAGDVDFIRRDVTPAQQHGDQPLKSAASAIPVPIPQELALELAAALERSGGVYLVTDATGRPTTPWAVRRAVSTAKAADPSIPEELRSRPAPLLRQPAHRSRARHQGRPDQTAACNRHHDPQHLGAPVA